ncbi:hypothetical protein CAAN3_04S06458 [[Candida] anglica]
MYMEAIKSLVDGQRELDQIVAKDTERKQLIRLAVVQALRLNGSINQKKNASREPTPTTISPNHEYELIINKLKQEHATKDKVFESKIETLKDELARLKQQIKEQNETVSAVQSMTNYNTKSRHSGNNINSSFSTSPYVSKLFNSKSYLSPTTNSLNKSISGSTSTATSLADVSTILSPIQPKRKVNLAATKPKRSYFNFNHMKKFHEEAMALGISTDIEVPIKKGNDQKLNVRGASVSNAVDSSSILGSLETSEVVKTPSKQVQAANTSVTNVTNFLTDGDEEEEDGETTFASANSTLNGQIPSSSSDEKGTKKKKKLQLWKSEATKITPSEDVNNNSPNKGLNLEDEETNTLNYYQDSNFLEDTETPKKLKRNARDRAASGRVTKKRKKNVFKID